MFLHSIRWMPFALTLSHSALKVFIEFKEETSICSVAYKRKWFRQEVRVGGQTTRSVPYVIVPIAHGSFPIEIKAFVKNSHLSDGIRKTLRVVVSE